MKNLVLVILLAVAVAAGYFFSTNGDEQVEDASSSTVEENVIADGVENDMPIAEESMITPADIPEEAQSAMYGTITDYNKCMMQNRLEYHQKGIKVANVADKTLQACEPHLDELTAVLVANNVNAGLTKNMANTMRSRAARKLMSAVMQSMAGQAAAMANTPVEAATE